MYVAIVFLPLLAAIIAGFGARLLGDRGAQLVTSGAVVTSAVLSVVTFFDVALGGNTAQVHLLNWVSSGGFEISWALRIDTLTAVILVVVNGVSSLVHIYSIDYIATTRTSHALWRICRCLPSPC